MSRQPERSRLVVDGMNVIGSRPTGWWRNPDKAKRGLWDRLRRLAEADGRAITLVLDGRPLPDLPEGERDGVEVLYARRSGPNAADDRIVEFAADRPDEITVVTSDRTLRDRLDERGVPVEGASSLLRKLDRLNDDDSGEKR